MLHGNSRVERAVWNRRCECAWWAVHEIGCGGARHWSRSDEICKQSAITFVASESSISINPIPRLSKNRLPKPAFNQYLYQTPSKLTLQEPAISLNCIRRESIVLNPPVMCPHHTIPCAVDGPGVGSSDGPLVGEVALSGVSRRDAWQ